LRTLEEVGALRAADGGWRLGELARVGVPTLLRQVVEGRLARLGEEARDLLALAAVLGQEAPLALWAALGETTEDRLAGVVERAVEGRVLEETRDGAAV